MIRGEWSGYLLHLCMYCCGQKFSGGKIQCRKLFAHLPLLLKPEGNGKLSKRDGDRLGFPSLVEWHDPKTGEISSDIASRGYFA